MIVFIHVPVHGRRNGLIKITGAARRQGRLVGEVQEEQASEGGEGLVGYERDIIRIGSVIVVIRVDWVSDEVSFGYVNAAAVLTRIVFGLEGGVKVVNPKFGRIVSEPSETVLPEMVHGDRALYPRS